MLIMYQQYLHTSKRVRNRDVPRYSWINSQQNTCTVQYTMFTYGLHLHSPLPQCTLAVSVKDQKCQCVQLRICVYSVCGMNSPYSILKREEKFQSYIIWWWARFLKNRKCPKIHLLVYWFTEHMKQALRKPFLGHRQPKNREILYANLTRIDQYLLKL